MCENRYFAVIEDDAAFIYKAVVLEYIPGGWIVHSSMYGKEFCKDDIFEDQVHYFGDLLDKLKDCILFDEIKSIYVRLDYVSTMQLYPLFDKE